MAISHTYTYVILEVSPDTFEEIRAKLEQADYQHAFHEDDGKVVIDMHGIALQSSGELACRLDGHCAKHGMSHSE